MVEDCSVMLHWQQNIKKPAAEFVFWLYVFVIHYKHPVYHHLIGVHLYKLFTCIGINKTCLNQTRCYIETIQ